MNYIEIEVDDHIVKVTTDQEVTPEYIKEIAEHIRKIENEQQPNNQLPCRT